MKTEEIQALLLNVLREIQETSGRAWKNPATNDTLIGGLDGFDSLSSIEATVMIEERLGRALGVDSFFISENGRRALTLKEVTERIMRLLRVKGVKE